jgi:hypothetical protein
MKKTLIILIGLFCSNLIFAQNDYVLYLQSGNIQMPENAKNRELKKEFNNKELWEGNYYRYLQFDKILSETEKENIAKLGVKLHLYYPQYTWVCEIPKNFDLNKLKEFGLRSIKAIGIEQKLTAELFTKDFPETALKENHSVEVMASAYANVNQKKVESNLKKLGVTVLKYDKEISSWRLIVPINKLEKLAQRPYFYFIEPTIYHGEPENLRGRTNHRSNYISENASLGLKYNGEGVEIAMFDDGSIGPHIDYTGRITAQYANTNATTTEHGDHVSGTIFGAGNLRPDVRGMAWGANLSVYNAALGTSADYNGFDSIASHYYNPGIVITSTSYSNGCNVGYTAFARRIDLQLHTYPALMHVFSAGNNGTSDCGYGAGAGWGNITGGHKAAKNCLTVGNLNFRDVIAGSSSRGPVHDGRIKPDISGVGVDVISTQPNNTFATYTGTSMSCPGLSGVLGQLYQAYKEYNANENPNGGLMKAIIMNTAEDVGNAGPDFIHGYGSVNARKALQVIQNNNIITSTIASGNSNNHTIEVPANTKQLKVMLYWVDKEASTGASIALVNDLNLQVTTPDNTVLNPWVLDFTPDVNALNAPAVRGIDNRNNVEQVTLENPVAGQYTINVNGFAVPVGPQEYFVVYYFETDEIVITYPSGGESFVPGVSETLRWDAYGVDGNFSIQYSADNGNNWTNVSTSVSPAERFYNWSIPNIITGKALIRITRNATTVVSAGNFSIIRLPTNISVSQACEDSIMVDWSGVSGATSYDVFLLGEKYMDSVGTTPNNYYMIKNINGAAEHWVSIRARGANDAVGKRANAVRKIAGTFDCLYQNDASINRIISPDRGQIPNCLNMTEAKIIVNLVNTGTNTISNVPVNYQINNNTIVTEIYSGSIASFDSVQYTFNAITNLNSTGTYQLKAWTSLAGDNHKTDDSTSTNFEIVNGTSKNIPWIENFDSYNTCVATGCTTVCNTITDGWINESNVDFDDIDWRVYSGSTPTSGTGPTADRTTGTGNYVYLESTSCTNRKAVLKTPCIDITGNTSPLELSFWYHMRGNTTGTLQVDINDGEKWINNIFSLSGNQSSNWLNAKVNITSYLNSNTIAVRFIGTTGNGASSDIALDDIGIDIATGLSKQESNNQLFSVYPNPAKDFVNIQLLKSNTNATISITDIQGRVFFEKNLETANSVQINTKDLAKGMYFISVKTDEEVNVSKIVVE